MRLYHWTLKENLKSIKRIGLKKSFREIYFCQNLENAKQWLNVLCEDSFYNDKKKWTILKVNISKNKLTFDKSIENLLQIIYKGKDIRPEKIEIIK